MMVTTGCGHEYLHHNPLICSVTGKHGYINLLLNVCFLSHQRLFYICIPVIDDLEEGTSFLEKSL